MKAITFNMPVAVAARKGIDADYELLTLSKGYKSGIADKEFMTSFKIGKIAGILQLDDIADAATVLAKAGPLVRKAPEKETDKQWAERQAKRKAAIKSGDIIERTKKETLAEASARQILNRFCKMHSVQSANAPRGKPGAKADEAKAADATPKANNAKSADSFLRQQAAMLAAYGEKNKPMLSTAMLHAIGEFVEAINTIPNQD